MNGPQEFHYRLPGRAGGFRPGSHPGTSYGAGQEFAMHARLVDYPDPRRLDLRASLQSVRKDWLVRLHLQRVAVPVTLIVDVSASMHFGATPKLHVVADFVDALGYSAFRCGDRVGLAAFDGDEREDLFVPARYGRGSGTVMAAMLRHARAAPERGDPAFGLMRAVSRFAGRQGLVFVVSDFHWPLDALPRALDLLLHSFVVPIVVWDPGEIEPPAQGRLLDVRDVESGARRTVWLSERVRGSWRDAVSRRRAEIDALFGKRGIRPFYVEGAFDPDALSRYFLEQSA